MPGEEKFFRNYARPIEQLHHRAQASASAYGGVPLDQFKLALYRSVEGRFRGTNPAQKDVEAYLHSLYLDDLALATACSAGAERAWEHFITCFRPELYAAARAICRRDESAARELADSLYAELFGVSRGAGQASNAERRSLFEYFHGRSKLSTWLRAILSQRFVDSVRASRRAESLDDEETQREAAGVAARGATSENDPDRARYLSLLQATLTSALAALAPRDRLRLAYYYVQDLTLAQIGRLLGEHEATVSRQLDRIRRELRQQVERALRAEKRLSDAQIHLCYEYAREEWPFDLTRALTERDSV